MGLLLDALGMAGTFATLYGSISGKLKDDHIVFKNQLRKNIIVICDAAIEAFNESPEFKSIIPSFADEVIYDEVIKALENKKQLNVDEIQRRLNILRRDVLDQLISFIDMKLQTSFEYSQRDYNAWSRQKTKDIESLLGNLKNDIAQIKEFIISTSNRVVEDVSNSYEFIYKRSQEIYYKMRSSRFSYIEIDNSLFADAKPKRFDIIINDSEKISGTLCETLKAYNGNFIFIGEGGTGKTTSLLQIWADWLVNKEEIPLYVPLNEYSNEINNFIETYIESMYSANINKINIPVILLLDGFNEINGSADKIIKELKYLSAKQKTRIVLTSRHSFINLYGLDGFNSYDIQPLSADVIHDFLVKANIILVDNWENLLSTPMMLTLYANTCAIRKKTEDFGLFSFKPSNSKGELIHNYLLCQLAKLITLEQKEILYSAYIALFGVAPYVAWCMETQGVFSISSKECRSIVTEYMSTHGDFIQKQAEDFLEEISFKLRFDLKETIRPIDVLVHIFYILAEVKIEDNATSQYSFQHQHFRDFLSAIHIDNTIIKALESHDDFKIPKEIKSRVFPPYIIEMISGYYGEYRNREHYSVSTRLHELLNRVRGMDHSDAGYTVNNIIRVWQDARNNRLIGENLTQLDLTFVPMNGIVFSDNHNTSHFDYSIISNATFLPQGHSGCVETAVYSKDGLRILSASTDNTIREWDRETGECIRVFEGHDNSVYSAVYNSEGNCILTTSYDKTVREWDRETGEQIRVFKGHSITILDAIYSEDGQRVLSASCDNTIREWDRTTGACLYVFEGHENSVESIVYSNDGRRILSASMDNTIREWDRETGQCINVINVRGGYISRGVESGNGVYSAKYSSDEHSILSALSDKTICEWDKKSGKCLKVFKGHDEAVTSAIYSSDGQRVLSTSFDYTIREWDRESGICLRVFNGHKNMVSSAMYSINERYILSASGDSTIREWDRETGECLRIFEGHRYNPTNVLYSSDEQQLISTYDDYTIREWDKESGICLRIYDGYNDSKASMISSKNGCWLLSAVKDNCIKEWDRRTGECVRTFYGHEGYVNSAIYSNDNLLVLSASNDSTIREWNRETSECIHVYVGHKDRVNSAIYSTDELRVLSSSEDGTVREWDRITGKCLNIFNGVNPEEMEIGSHMSIHHRHKQWDGMEDHVRSAMYSSDGKRILSAHSNCYIREWSRETRECLNAFNGTYGSMGTAIYSDDGNRILYIDFDTIIELDWVTGKILRKYEGHSVNSVVYNKNGTRILSSSDDGTIREWNRETGECLWVATQYGGMFFLNCSFHKCQFLSSEIQKIVKIYSGHV